MAVDDLGLVPEEFLFQADAFDAFDQTAGEEVCVCPQDFVDFGIQPFEVGSGVFNDIAGFAGLFAGLEFAVNDFTVLDIRVGGH
ncbi:MAG: hypothetical protein AB1Z18_01695, partial [Desulfobacterales bacterium]